MKHSLGIVLMASLLLLLADGGGSWANSGTQALQIKGAFVHNFLKFTEWPAEVMNKKGRELALAVIGNDPMASTLQEELDGKVVRKRKVRVRLYSDLSAWKAEGEACHVLFVTAEARPSWPDLQTVSSNRAILTIADSPGFCSAGGMLNLFEKDDHIRFEANPSAAKQAGLKLRADLLSLATLVASEGTSP